MARVTASTCSHCRPRRGRSASTAGVRARPGRASSTRDRRADTMGAASRAREAARNRSTSSDTIPVGRRHLVLAAADGIGHRGPQRHPCRAAPGRQRGRVRLDIAGHAEVDHDQVRSAGPAVSAALEVRAGRRSGASADRGEGHVDLRQEGDEVVEVAGRHRCRRPRPATRRPASPTRSAVRLAMTRCSTSRPSRAWATPSPISPAPMMATRAPASPPSRRVGGQGHGTVGQRGDAPGDGRFRPDPLARLDGMAEEGAEHRAGRLLALGPVPGPADLTQHLGLAEHGRLEPGRHPEQVAGHIVVEPDGAVLGQRVHRAVHRDRPGTPGSRPRRRGSAPPPRRPRSAGRSTTGRPRTGWAGHADVRAPWRCPSR